MLKEQLKDLLNENHFSLFDKVENASKRMQKLIDDLLDYSQIAEESSTFEAVDLNILIKTILEDLELEVQNRSAAISVSVLPTVQGNRRQLQQLFQNLISNSLKYAKDSVRSEIAITSSMIQGKDAAKIIPHDVREKMFYALQISDNGIGFDPSQAENIFKVFTRLHN